MMRILVENVANIPCPYIANIQDIHLPECQNSSIYALGFEKIGIFPLHSTALFILYTIIWII